MDEEVALSRFQGTVEGSASYRFKQGLTSWHVGGLEEGAGLFAVSEMIE